MRDDVAIARKLAALDGAMRRRAGFGEGVAARVRFFETALREDASRRLNRLGELVPRSMLSDRSLDPLFEDGEDMTGAVLRRLLADADRDPALRAALQAQGWGGCLAGWRETAAARTQRELFAPLISNL